ncbi:MAG TPA: glycoside hydrolase family 3 N-terminal domain-containing protein [Actinomycetota bacterium]|nr:glycoside hydrolase family 3 N-terminal domain-containing protein [Actinomycetota bacterium]
MRGGRGMRLVVIVAVAGVLAAAFPTSPSAAPAPSLSLREKVGQIVMFSVDGYRLAASEQRAIEANRFGAVTLFSSNYRDRTQLRHLTAQLQRVARQGNGASIGAIVATDQEGGIVKRFPDMPPYRSAPEMGRDGRRSFALRQGRLTGKALREAGVNVDLAPVADLDLPPEHVMRERSFGRNPRRVARLVAAFAHGLQRHRVAATIKHFPGFGGANVNSDDGRAFVYRSRWQLRHVDAVPFHAAIDGGARMVMLSHGMYVHDGGRQPASLSHYIATKRLRKGFSFTGVAVSDALNEVSWRFGGDLGKTCVATVRAGVDLALITGGIDQARVCALAIRNAVRRGRVSRARLDQAVSRVLALKTWLGVYSP